MAAHSRVTLSSLRARLTDRVGGAGPFWSDEEKNDSINEALCIWSALTGEFTRTVTVPALPLGVIFQDDAFDAGSFQIHDASVSFFFVPTQIASLLRVSWNGTPLALVSAFELDNGYVGWQDITGTPLYWTPVGVSIFAVYPAPTSGTFTLDGLKENIRLVSDGDFVDLGDEEITKLLDYAHFYASFKEATGEFQTGQTALKRLFEAAALRNSRFKATNTFRRAMGLSKDDLEKPARAEGGDIGVRA